LIQATDISTNKKDRGGEKGRRKSQKEEEEGWPWSWRHIASQPNLRSLYG
jgi:hypothetical protein